MTLAELQSLVGSLTADPNHDRYSLADINVELDNAINQWNQEIKVIRQTTTILTVDGTRQYALSNLGIFGAPLEITRVTHKGLDLKKRSKQYFDLYGADWTLDPGTPTEFCVESTDPANLFLTLHPTPGGNDAGLNLVVEAIVAHTAMSSATDVPFLYGTSSNFILRPYDFYLAYSAASRLLARDPSELNIARSTEYLKISAAGKANLIQVFKALEAEVPKRLQGGRYWNFGNALLFK